MTRFFVATALAAVVGLGTAGTADAQYVQQRYNLTPNGGVVVTTNYNNYGSFRTNQTYASPYGLSQRTLYNDAFGNAYGRSAGYNNFYGSSYDRGFYQPSPLVNPFGAGYNYNTFSSPFGGGYNYNTFVNPYAGGYNSGFYRRW